MPVIAQRVIGRTQTQVSTLGMGGAPLGGLGRFVTSDSARGAIQAALAAGITYFDTAPYYGFGFSERRMGDELRGRAGITLSSKVGRLLKPGAIADPSMYGWDNPLPFGPVFDYSYDGVMRSYEDSLQRLGLDRIDILYVHDVAEDTHGPEATRVFFKEAMTGGYRALDELRKSGAVRAIGLGVNGWEACRKALDHGDWDVFLLAGRYSLLEQEPVSKLFPACEARGVSIVVGGAFNSGVLAGGTTFNYGAIPKEVAQRVRALKEICDAHEVPIAAAALQFPMGHPVVVSVIPGARSEEQFSGILEWASFPIPPQLWEGLRSSGLLADGTPTPGPLPYGG